MSKLVSANDLATGAVVFLRADGAWVAGLDEACSFADAAAAETGLAAAPRASVVDPFLVDRKDDTHGAASLTLRNAIRAFGPTIDYRPPLSDSTAEA